MTKFYVSVIILQILKKIKILLLFIILIFSVNSCDLDSEKDEEIMIHNQTAETVIIYYNTKSILTAIYSDETMFVFVSTNIEYRAEGRDSKKDYGSKIFSKVPSSWNVQQTWVIRDE